MELRVLRYFLTVAREGSFSRAAEKLHLSQPTLSRQIKELEDEFGKQLLVREPRHVLLTDDGQLLRRRAEEILSLAEKTAGELMSGDEDISGDIRIGAGESVHFSLIMEAARQIQEKYPGIRFHIVTGDGRTTLTRLDRGLIDFAFVYGKLAPSKYSVLDLPVRDRWVLFLRKDDVLAEKETIRAEDLWERPLLFSRQALSSSTHGDELLQWLQKPLEELHVAGSYTLLYNATLMVREGLGYAISFADIVNTAGTELCTRPLQPPVYTEPSVAWKKNQVFSKASKLFLQTLEEKFRAK